MRFSAIALIFMALLWPWLAHAAPQVTRVQLQTGSNAERILLQSPNELEEQAIFTLSKPERLVIDLPALQNGDAIRMPAAYDGFLIRDIRYGRFDEDTSRIVVDLSAPATIINVYRVTPPAGQPWQLAIDLQPASGYAPDIAPAPKEAAYSPAEASRILSESGFDYIPLPVLKPTVAAREAKKPIIVLDAGHGGKDVGAIGLSGVYEKHITMQFAKALRTALLRTGRYRVVMTRDNDRYILLHDRVKLARAAQGDLFISLHADSNPNASARGLSVYTLSDEASDAEAAALAARENKSDIIAGVDLAIQDEDVANILIDLARRETKNKSSELAEEVIGSVHRKVNLLPRPHRFAGFRVLKAPDIPSILVEVGFLSNRSDEKLLQTAEYQSRVVEGIVKAIDGYFLNHSPR